MRVIAGSARSIPLVTPPGKDTRPTTDRIKETLFNMLQFELSGSRFIDVFAGSGAIGIEALSRGAGEAVFIDNGRSAVDCIRKNLQKCRFTDRALVLQMDALSAVRRLSGSGHHERKTIVFLDPPYDEGLEYNVLKALSESGLLDEESTVIVETSLKSRLSEEAASYGYICTKEKEYKNQKHVFLKLS